MEAGQSRSLWGSQVGVRADRHATEQVPEDWQGALRAAEVQRILARTSQTALGVPYPNGRDLKRLLNAFAPVWQIDEMGGYDRIGMPHWEGDGASIGIDVRQPTVFTHVSHTVFGGRVLLQLNYSVWFPSRPASGNFDLLGGRLDGIIWRVTLDGSGRAVFYDTIHACGCYHLVFPLVPVDKRAHSQMRAGLREAPAILADAPELAPGQSIVLRVASGTHYLVGVDVRDRRTGTAARKAYRLQPDELLRSLPLPGGGRRSLYGPDGIVAGSERLERYLLWPSGVLSPGAMRQRGHHAIALTGRRHFDDAELFAELFAEPNDW